MRRSSPAPNGYCVASLTQGAGQVCLDMEGRKYSLFGQCVTLVHDPAGQFIQPEKRKTMSCAVLSLCLDCRYSEKLNLEGESTIAF